MPHATGNAKLVVKVCAFRAIRLRYSNELHAWVLKGCEHPVEVDAATGKSHIACAEHSQLEVRFARNAKDVGKLLDTKFLAGLIGVRGKKKNAEVLCIYAFSGETEWKKATKIQQWALKKYLPKLSSTHDRKAFIRVTHANSLVGAHVMRTVDAQGDHVSMGGEIIKVTHAYVPKHISTVLLNAIYANRLIAPAQAAVFIDRISWTNSSLSHKTPVRR